MRNTNSVMELKEEESQPVSPTGQYLSSSALSLCIVVVLESEVSIDVSRAVSLLSNVLVPSNPRFSSIMVVDEKGEKQWKKVDVTLKDHVKVPIFPSGMSPESYDRYLDEHISRIGMEELPRNQPLWEFHIINYPTSNAAATLIFKLHHCLGDGFSLMGVVFTCLQRADNPSLSLTFPSVKMPSNGNRDRRCLFKRVSEFFSVAFRTVSDFSETIMRSRFVEDDQTPIRSGDAGVEYRAIEVATMDFSLDHIKQIKAQIGATINDVITGIIFFGTRLYMQKRSHDSKKSRSTAIVLLNTRAFRGYESVKDMIKPNAKAPWGNYFAFLHVSMPELNDASSSNPLDFVLKARQIMNQKKISLGVYLNGTLLEILKKLRGPEAVARYIHGTLKNSSMGISNIIGPAEQMAFANHPIRGFYFFVVGGPQSLSITIMSYMGKLRVVVVAEKGFIDPHKLKSYIEDAFEMVLKAAIESTPQQKS